MKFAYLFLLCLTAFVSSQSRAVSICYNNICGKLTCERGCVQKVVNGRCVENYCVGRSLSGLSAEETDRLLDDSTVSEASPSQRAACVSCARGCCHRGWNFRSAEAACKAHHGAFGCFTRC